MSDVVGCDISFWQGQAGVDFNIEQMWQSGMRFVFMRAGQGLYVDKWFARNYAAFRASGHPWKLGAYWFVTTDNAIKQADLFRATTELLTLELGLALDVEFYTMSDGYTYNADQGVVEYTPEYSPVVNFRYDRGLYVSLAALLSMSITTEAIVDVMARRLEGQQGWPQVTIYTNQYSGNTVFKKSVSSRLHLWIAHWPAKGQVLARPTLPIIWKAADKWLAWQCKVDAGADHGVPGSLDHDVWGNEMPFPGDQPPPEPAGWAVTVVVSDEDETLSGKTVLQ